MAFEKGKNKTGGRELGTPNKTTANLRLKIQSIIESQFETIEEDLKALEPKDRLSITTKLLEYIMPKQKDTKIDFNSLSDEEISNLIERIIHESQSQN